MNHRTSTLVSLCRPALRISMSCLTLVILTILCSGKAKAKTEQHSINIYSSQPSSNSYSQVRFTSTRRNGTYDSHSLANNLANHRLQMQPNKQPMYIPNEENVSSLSHSVLQQPSAIDVQSAINDAIRQDASMTTPSGELNALFANFYPQFHQAFQNQAPTNNPSNDQNDLHHMPSSSVIHKVAVQTPMMIDHAAKNGHNDMIQPEEHIREYHHDAFNNSFNPASSTLNAHNPSLMFQATNPDKHYDIEGKPSHGLVEKEIEHVNMAGAYDFNDSHLDNEFMMTTSQMENIHNFHSSSSPIINDHLNSDEYVTSSSNNDDNRRIDSETTECVACRIFHEEMMKNQQVIKNSAAAENSIPHRDNTKIESVLITTEIPKEESMSLSTNNEESKVDLSNFTAPTVNELFSINDAVIPQVGPPNFPNSTRLIPQNNIFPQNVPVNNFQPQILQQNIPNHVAGIPQSQNHPIIQLPPHPSTNIHNRDSVANVPFGPLKPIASQSNLIPLQPQPLSSENIKKVQFFQPSSLTGNQQKPVAIPLPSQMMVQNAGSFVSTANKRNHVLPSQFFQGFPTRNTASLPTLMNGQIVQGSGPVLNPLANMQHHSSIDNTNFQKNSPMFQKVDTTPPGIHGPMGIRIPIPPKTVPAHSVMAPPISLPPIHSTHPTPPRRNGGIFDSLMNFFGGGKNQNRGRSLEGDDGVLLNETSEIYNSTFLIDSTDNMTYENLINDEASMQEDNVTSRVRRATILDQLPDYLDGLFKRFSDDVKRIASPLIPSIKDAIRNSAISRYIYGEEVDKKKTSSSLWSLFLDNYTQSSSTVPTNSISSLKNGFDKSEASRINKVHELLSSKMENLNQKRNMNKSSNLEFHPPCATDEGMPFCLQDEHYPKAFLANMLLQLKKANISVKCNVVRENHSPIAKSFSRDMITCESPEQKIQPLRAKDTKGIWKIVVNIPNHCEQVVEIRKCHPSCMNCKEVKATYNLLTFDQQDGFRNDDFRFSNGCSCAQPNRGNEPEEELFACDNLNQPSSSYDISTSPNISQPLPSTPKAIESSTNFDNFYIFSNFYGYSVL